MGRFNGKVVIVTGATSGIGKAAAIQFAAEGAKVVVAGRRIAEGEETVKQIRLADGKAIFVQTDVAKAEDNERLVKVTLDTYGRLDAVFNNAGTEGKFSPTSESTEETWDYTHDINLKGAWLGLKYQIPALLQSGGGAIVFNSSAVAEVGVVGAAIYSASKGGLNALARSVAMEYAGQGIRVNVVNPGPIETEMAERAFGNLEDARKSFGTKIPLGRLGFSEEIAEAAVFLASDSASYITGQVLNVDGGYTAQ